jgi:hypothetical protein
MTVMSRATLLENLRRAGFADVAAAIAAQLPDPVDLDEYRPLLESHGVSRGGLEDAFGGSP